MRIQNTDIYQMRKCCAELETVVCQNTCGGHGTCDQSTRSVCAYAMEFYYVQMRWNFITCRCVGILLGADAMECQVRTTISHWGCFLYVQNYFLVE
jgi:hypothetical protein